MSTVTQDEMTINAFARDSHVLHRNLTWQPSHITSGNGISLILDSGRRVLDASAGPSVSCIGHHQPEVAAAVAKQINEIAYVYSGSPFTSAAGEELASILLARRPGGLSKAIFVNSGSEATDAALKLATQYWCEIGRPEKCHFIARRQSYHGNTIGALCVSGHEGRRALYGCWMSQNVSFVDPCYAFRCKVEGESDEGYVQRLRDQFEEEVLRVGPDRVAAFVAETVTGTTLGCVPAVPGYFKAMREVCDKYDILLILDEIMCGMGKTGTLHAWEQEDIRGPDIQMIGKALGGGFVPLSAVLLHQRIFDAMASGSKGLLHGHTFQAHPTACAGAVQVQKIIRRDNLLENVRSMGSLLMKLLKEIILPLLFVADVRGKGLFLSVEFMKNPARRTPFEVDSQFSNNIVTRALENGLNILGNLGATGSIHIEHVILCPPYTVTEQEIGEIVQILRKSIEEVSAAFAAPEGRRKEGSITTARL